MRTLLPLLFCLAMSTVSLFAQNPPPGALVPGVSRELAQWRAARYSDVRYKLNLTLEKMSPVLKGTMEIRLNVGTRTLLSATPASAGEPGPIILDWRKLKGHEDESTITRVSINGTPASVVPPEEPAVADKSVRVPYENEHLIFRNGVVAGENVIRLDFTSPILTSGSAITRYVDKEDGSEYIYSLFVPSDASTAFPVFDQPDIKARFELTLTASKGWKVVSNGIKEKELLGVNSDCGQAVVFKPAGDCFLTTHFARTAPISTYVFAFAAGPWEKVPGAGDQGGNPSRSEGVSSTAGRRDTLPTGRVSASDAELSTSIYVRKSQAAKFQPHAAEVFRLNREAVRYFEQYFDYKFPFPKYDLVLIPEFPFGGMEHAGATFLKESSVIFPQEPTRNDIVNRATLIFHETAHQWFGDTVTMRWFDDLWLKEGFATFMGYKALEKIMPETNAWKVFYERVKQGAYQTDSTRGTTAIYQPIANLSAAKSAYGNIVYNKAPAFLRQAEFYLGEEKFQTAVRAFLKKHEFGNAEWKDLVIEFGRATNDDSLGEWAKQWVTQPGVPVVKVTLGGVDTSWVLRIHQKNSLGKDATWRQKVRGYVLERNAPSNEQNRRFIEDLSIGKPEQSVVVPYSDFHFINHGDYGYGIFLLDDKSRDYVLKNIQNEKDPFLRTMMWGALWDSVREGELDPRVFVELVVKVLGASGVSATPSAAKNAAATPPGQGGESRMQKPAREQGRNAQPGDDALANARASATEEDESTVAVLLGRVGTALNYYIDDGVSSPHVSKGSTLSTGRVEPSLTVGLPTPDGGLRTRVEDMLIERIRNAPTLGQRITYYRALLNVAASERARGVLKEMLAGLSSPHVSKGSTLSAGRVEPSLTVGLQTQTAAMSIPLKTKDRFDIVTRLLIMGDAEAPKLLAELEKTETSDDAKRYAYAARAGIGTAENKAKYWKDFTGNKEISESWIEAAFGPWNSIRHAKLTLPYLERALKELPNHKRNRKIFFVNGWLGAFFGGQRSAEALAIVNKFLADNPGLDNDLRLKILENVDLIERAVNIRRKFPTV